MAKKTVLSLFESRGDLKIDEARLSAPLRKKIAELDALLLVLDHLKGEVGALTREASRFRMLSLSSVAAAVLGVVLGVMGLVEGVLGVLQVGVSFVAALGLLGVEFFVLRYQRVTRGVLVQKHRQVQSLSSDLEVRLDTVYDEVLAEQYEAPRPPSFPRSPTARQRARRGEERS